MKKRHILVSITGLFIGSFGIIFPSCDSNEPLGLNSSAPEFDIDLFEENLRTTIEGMVAQNRPIGWAYAINKDGQFFSADGFGLARTAADPTSISFTENKVINVASISKFFTAIAVLQLLDQRNLTLESSIATWLPGDWSLGPDVANLTFRDLLTHMSGLQSSNTNFSQTLCFTCLQSMVNTGVVGSKAQRNYLNANFALFRVIIPALWRGLPGGPPQNENLTDATTQQRYLQYMQEKIFTPAGVPNADCLPENASSETVYYRPADGLNALSGSRIGNWTAISGGGGYFLSAIEVAKVLAHFENSETLLSNEMKSVMKSNRIGFDLANTNGKEMHGAYYGKNGSITDGNNRGVLTQTLSFPINKVEVVVVMNTQVPNFPNGNSLSALLHDAYNEAWISPNSK